MLRSTWEIQVTFLSRFVRERGKVHLFSLARTRSSCRSEEQLPRTKDNLPERPLMQLTNRSFVIHIHCRASSPWRLVSTQPTDLGLSDKSFISDGGKSNEIMPIKWWTWRLSAVSQIEFIHATRHPLHSRPRLRIDSDFFHSLLSYSRMYLRCTVDKWQTEDWKSSRRRSPALFTCPLNLPCKLSRVLCDLYAHVDVACFLIQI